MSREIKILITKDGKVEIDSSIYKDCKDVAEHLTKNLGKMESFMEKSEGLFESAVKVKIDK